MTLSLGYNGSAVVYFGTSSEGRKMVCLSKCRVVCSGRVSATCRLHLADTGPAFALMRLEVG